MSFLNKGDILIDRKTLKKYPIVDVDNGFAFMELRSKLVKRSFGQIMKYKKNFVILRKGETLEKDFAFYCPEKDKLIILKAGAVFLGDV